MKRNRFTVEQIIRMLREAEVHLSQGKSVAQVPCPQIMYHLLS